MRKRRSRLERAWHFVEIYLYVLVVYGGAIITDYVLFALVGFLLQPDIEAYPLVADVFDLARIALALMGIAVAMIHGIIAMVRQIRLDFTLVNEDVDEDEHVNKDVSEGKDEDG